MAELSRVLVQLKEDCDLPIPIDDMKLDGVPSEPLAVFLAEHGFTSLLKRLDGGKGSPDRPTQLNPAKARHRVAHAAQSMKNRNGGIPYIVIVGPEQRRTGFRHTSRQGLWVPAGACHRAALHADPLAGTTPRHFAGATPCHPNPTTLPPNSTC